MKKILLISLAILALHAPVSGHAEPRTFSILLAGGVEANIINIWLTEDGKTYVIDSIVPLEVGGSVCTNPEGQPNELLCQAPLVSGFEVNSDGGDDQITVAPNITVSVTMRGGAGNDVLRGGAGDDRLYGSSGDDRLFGKRGNDVLNGGADNDVVFGGPGDDVLVRGLGQDTLRGGPGDNEFRDHRGKSSKPAASPSQPPAKTWHP
ncbi:MAG: calcium-binding protein [Solirubrobacterales bacterium]